jgi:transposase-like protein
MRRKRFCAKRGRDNTDQGVTLDTYAASQRAVPDPKEAGELPKGVIVRSRKYLNNLIERDHRRIFSSDCVPSRG